MSHSVLYILACLYRCRSRHQIRQLPLQFLAHCQGKLPFGPVDWLPELEADAHGRGPLLQMNLSPSGCWTVPDPSPLWEQRSQEVAEKLRLLSENPPQLRVQPQAEPQQQVQIVPQEG